MKTSLPALLVLLPAIASANQRHYAYTYETATLPMGAAEIEPWTTVRLMREDYYVRFDHRLEFEVGLLDNFQAAFYLNWQEVSSLSTDDKGTSSIVGSSAFKGISLELKGKLLDPQADPIGLGLYFEIGGLTNELEIEAKVLLDKHFGDFGVALNAVYEAEFEAEVESGTDTELELHAHEIQVDLGFAYFISPRWSVALELVSRTELAKNEADEFETEYSILSLGPTVGYAGERFWITASILPQLAALAGATGDSLHHLEDKERLELRLLMGFEI